MRVALVAHHVGPTGGQDRYALELARRLSGRVDVDLVCMRLDGEVPPGVVWRRVRPAIRPMLVRAPVFRAAARRALRRGSYDLVHAPGGALPGADIITAHFCHAAWRLADPGMGPYQRLVTALATGEERRAYGDTRVRAIIAVSRRVADDIETHYGPLAVPVSVIPNGVDLGTFAPRPRTPRDRPVLLFVGAYARKGLDVAIGALARMRRPATLRAVGAGPRGPYVSLARRAGVADRVSLEPPRADVAEVMADADAFVFPTRYEPFGMVIAEALACGVPVVTSSVAGAATLVADGVSGYVVPDPNDAEAFAHALDSVLDAGAARGPMGVAARGAVADLSWDRIAEETLAVYRRAGARQSS